MTIFFDKLILFTCCILLMFYYEPQVGTFHVISLLCAVIFTCASTFFNVDYVSLELLNKENRMTELLSLLLFAILILVNPAFGIFFPILFYELCICFRSYFYLFSLLLPILSFRTESLLYPALILILSFMAYVMVSKTNRLFLLEEGYKRLRDTSMERNLLLNQKNKDLLEKQDYEIHVATLKERNRIAREIHDNVGHLLSRSILQAGALIAVNQQESLKEPLSQMKDTLSSAMDSIRQSVHDLHDESIDLHAAITGLLADFSKYDVTFDFDAENTFPQKVKYCLISIVKEALSNISRHSNASRIDITLREHPNLYQLIIHDNGSCMNRNNSGIGLENMKERVDNLNGHFTVTEDHGFRIFVSIPRHT